MRLGAMPIAWIYFIVVVLVVAFVIALFIVSVRFGWLEGVISVINDALNIG